MLLNARSSALVLLAVNSLPLFGVWFFDWSIFDVVFLYWAENVVIGAINILRMVVANPGAVGEDVSIAQQSAARNRGGHGQKFFMVPFFAVHYGMFCYGHQVFLVGMFDDEKTLLDVLSDPVIMLGILAIAASHLYSFVTNFMLAGENQRTTPTALMMRPYGRIIVLHVTIILGVLLYQTLGEQSLVLLVLIVVKTLVDFRQHGRERAMFAPANTLGDALGERP